LIYCLQNFITTKVGFYFHCCKKRIIFYYFCDCFITKKEANNILMYKSLIIKGLIQGVGFRPFIYLLANNMGIKGTVSNRNNGVRIVADLSEADWERFIRRISEEHPPVASIHSMKLEDVSIVTKPFADFTILSSVSESDEVTQVAPDIAVCDDCMNDRQMQPHRLKYPFINCTHCGPRFSIIKDLPYDRSQTTMSDFMMCERCSNEYKDISNRRFHAQPIACNNCGPKYYINDTRYTVQIGENRGLESILFNDYQDILKLTCELIDSGKVIAVKGIGGYHLVCDASSEKAVLRLREIKARDTKPFAVMFRDIPAMLPYVQPDEEEKKCLRSWRRPIVLLSQRNDGKILPDAVNPGMKTLGCMLPYMPVHFDWFERLKSPVLVVTSGNLNDRPIIISPEEAETELGGKVDLIVHHDRPIHNRTDDSVVQVCERQACLIRRSRGYVPEPFFADVSTEGILAFGAEKVNTFALGKGNTIIQSQYIGDLKNEETFAFYKESMERFSRLFRLKTAYLACDLHPDYLSTIYAEKIAAEQNLPLLKVQHHHAHAVACMTEYALHEPVIAIVWDGIGLGDDGAAWGGEFFLCDRKSYRRLAMPEYVAMPGGDRASLEPWRMTTSYMKHYQLPLPESFIERIGEDKIYKIQSMIDRKIQSPLTSSIGRLFDAFASLTGICDINTRQAEAAILLEQIADKSSRLCYSMAVDTGNNAISFRSLFEDALDDLQHKIPVEQISAKFHNTLVNLAYEKAQILAEENAVNKVVISGGCFQNKFLVEALIKRFAGTGIRLYTPAQIPCNDSGIAVGQLTIASEHFKI
jgi:hydrogenase maturation protein HypF